MKKNAFATLIKDIILALVAWGISAMLLQSGLGMPGGDAAMLATMCAGIPFGWRIASSFITAVSMRGVVMKLGIALLVGMFAIFIVLGWDVIRCIGQLIGNGAKKNRQRYVEGC